MVPLRFHQYYAAQFTVVLLLLLSSAASAKRCDCASDKEDLKPKWKELIMLELFFTLETLVRGFLMGFGATILQDLLLQGKRSKDEVQKTKEFGVIVGLGLGCFMVGGSMLVPRSWRVSGMQ
ncbi:hypothetical protein TL16_g13152, partial [Triparma laevis f. inornata]